MPAPAEERSRSRRLGRPLGFGLAVRFAGVGVPIAIGSRDAARAEETAERARVIAPERLLLRHENADAVRAAGR